MPGKVTMTVEDNIVFMTDPKIEFVSLVKHGANQIPFKILKSDKGGNFMSKVLQALIVPKSLEAEAVEKLLEGYRSDEVKEFKTYKSYTQVDLEDINPESIEVVQVDKEKNVFGVIGELKAESKVKDAKEMGSDDKQAVDYVTMDNLYMELYAMADIVSGAMAQDSADAEFRSKTILTAIDNFRVFAEAVLSNLKDAKAVNREDFPTLLYPFVKVEKKEDPPPPDKKDDEPDVNTLLEAIKTQLQEVSQNLTNEMKTKFDEVSGLVTDLTKRLDGVEEYTNSLKTTLKTNTTAKVDDAVAGDEKKSVWTGTIFKQAQNG